MKAVLRMTPQPSPQDETAKTAAEAIRLAERFERRANDWDMDGPSWNGGVYRGPTEMGKLYREMAKDLREAAKHLP